MYHAVAQALAYLLEGSCMCMQVWYGMLCCSTCGDVCRGSSSALLDVLRLIAAGSGGTKSCLAVFLSVAALFEHNACSWYCFIALLVVLW